MTPLWEPSERRLPQKADTIRTVRSMADLHIDDFCHDALRVLLQLYHAFPRRQAVYVEDVSGPDEPDEVGLHSRRYMACLGAMLWLAEEGYIRYESTIYQDGIDQAVLTNRTFVLMTALSELRLEDPPPQVPPSVAHEKMTLAEQMRAALRSKSSDRITAIVRYFLSRDPQPVTPDEFGGVIGDRASDKPRSEDGSGDFFL